MQTTSGVAFTLVSTYPEALQAATALNACPVLIIDCEGENLGHPQGALTLLSISAADGSLIHLIDVLALRDPNHSSLQPLLALLTSDRVLKVFWDGRTDVLELSLVYGVQVAPVLDLQVAEVVHRSKWQPKGRHLRALAEKSFHAIRNDVLVNPELFGGIYPLIGLDACLRFQGLVKEHEHGKDAQVVEMHKNQGSAMWAERPLPDKLLAYAARDVQLIAALYQHIMQRWQIDTDDALEKLKRQSTTYVSIYRTREIKARHHALELGRFMAMGVLDDPSAHETRYTCARCELELPLSCFENIVEPAGIYTYTKTAQKWRWSACRLCAALAYKNHEATEGWVKFGCSETRQ